MGLHKIFCITRNAVLAQNVIQTVWWLGSARWVYSTLMDPL